MTVSQKYKGLLNSWIWLAEINIFCVLNRFLHLGRHPYLLQHTLRWKSCKLKYTNTANRNPQEKFLPVKTSLTLNKLIFLVYNIHGEAGMSQWWECLPHTTVAQVLFLDLASHAGWLGSRPCSKGFSVGSPVFHPPQKPTLLIPMWSRNESHRFVSFAVSVPLTK